MSALHLHETRKVELLRANDIPALMFEKNPQAMCIVDARSLRISAANESAAVLYRYRRQELLTLTLFELCDPAEYERLLALNAVCAGGRSHSGIFRQRRKDGKLLRVRATWTSENSGSGDMLWAFEDQTPLDNARAVAQDAGERLESLLNDAPHGVCRYQLRRGVVEYANREMLSICGLTGTNETEMYRPQALVNCFVLDSEADEFAKAVRSTVVFRQKAQWRGYDGVLRTIGIYAYPMAANAADRIIQIEDITAEHALAQQSEQREKMESLGRVAATVAHDFNNILLVMRGYAEMLRHTLLPSSVEGRHAAALLAAADSAAEVTSALVGFARKDEHSPERLDLNELVREMGSSFFPTLPEQINGRLALAHEPVFVMAQRTQMQRMLLNLAANARDAMPGGGQLTVATMFRDGSLPGIRECCVEIRDTGTGMDETTRARLFERFFTTKAAGRGTGLGLAFVESCMTQLGGRVEVESYLGLGSCFRLVFAREEAEMPRADVRPVKSGRHRGYILLVDDDEHIRALVSDFLTMLDYKIMSASSAELALQLLTESSQQIDLLLTDLTLPGMSGRELAERVRVRTPSIPVLLMSGLPQTEELKEAGFGVIAKPFSIGEIQEQLEQALLGETRAA